MAAVAPPAAPAAGAAGAPLRTVFLVLLLGMLVLLLADAEGFIFSGRPVLNAHIHTALGTFEGSAAANGTARPGAPPPHQPQAAPRPWGLDTGALLYDGLTHEAHLARVEALAAADPSALAPLTARAQRLLYEWQHPPRCEGRTFVVSQGNDPRAGIGSHIHIASHHFAVALELGAVFVWADNVGSIYTDPDTCGDGGDNNLQCFFLPPSNCTLQDAHAPGNTIVSLRFGDAGEAAGYGYKFYHVPALLQRLWEGAGLPAAASANTGQQDAVKYWFRGQVAAYLMRPNAATAAAFRALRTAPGAMLTAAGPAAPAQQRAALGAPALPLPPGLVSLHIRHGDKGSEMKLVPTEAYLEAAARLVKMHPMALAPRGIFMSTEDPEAPVLAGQLLAGAPGFAHWSMAWYDVPRANSNGPEQLSQFSLPRGVLSRIWLLQILLALECDAWVGTRGSNWNRVIDELRCVWVPKCQNVFEEVGDFERWEKCVRPARVSAGPPLLPPGSTRQARLSLAPLSPLLLPSPPPRLQLRLARVGGCGRARAHSECAPRGQYALLIEMRVCPVSRRRHASWQPLRSVPHCRTVAGRPAPRQCAPEPGDSARRKKTK